jgi:hypothetical protein
MKKGEFSDLIIIILVLVLSVIVYLIVTGALKNVLK